MINRDLFINRPSFNTNMLKGGTAVCFNIEESGYEVNGIVCDVSYDRLYLTVWDGEVGSMRHTIELDDYISGKTKIKIL